MVATPRRLPMPPGDSPRPYAFLVSTTGCARGIAGSLGSAAYSYYFVLEALAPVFEKLGTWRLLDRPESSLPFAAAKAEAEGYQPIHLALHPPQDVYLTPALPNVIFPFWEFPDLPDRDFGHDTRQNWTRVCSRADMIITACQFTADAFQRAGIKCPIGVVPVPLKPEHFAVPDWTPTESWTHNCRHLTWGDPPAAPLKLDASQIEEEMLAEAMAQAELEAMAADDELASAGEMIVEETIIEETVVEEVIMPAEPAAPAPRMGMKKRTYMVARKVFRKVYPWLGERTLTRIAKTRHYVLESAGRDPRTFAPLPGPKPGLTRLGYAVARDTYRLHVKRWLSPAALQKITEVKENALQAVGHEPVMAPDPLLPAHPLTLSGLVFTSIFNLGDRRKNHLDLLTAYLLAFRDRPDVTMVIKLATNPKREHHEVAIFRQMYHGLGIQHRCRLVLITDFLTDQGMADLMRVTTFYVNTSKAEGACLPLQQSLAGGRPSLAPDHTAMADFMDNEVGFVLGTNPEPTYWPHDPEMRIETTWNRLVWSDLHDRLLDAANLVETDFPGYQQKATAARARMKGYASREIVAHALAEALKELPKITTGRLAWAS